jgi:hypothetical protein
MTDTVYNNSSDCKGCGALVSPIEKLFAYDKDLCADCRNIKATKRVKSGMV